MNLAVEAGQPVGDLLTVAETHPDVIETLAAYLAWRQQQQRR